MFNNKRTGTLFDDFLVSSLDGAFSLPKMDGIAESIAENLYLDVVAVRVKPFHEHACIFEQVLTTGLDRFKCFFDVLYMLTRS